MERVYSYNPGARMGPDRIRQKGHLRKIWWSCVCDDLTSLGLSVADTQ